MPLRLPAAPVGLALSAVLAAGVSAAAAWPARAPVLGATAAAAPVPVAADPGAVPASVRVPSLGLAGPVSPVGLLADRTLQVPADPTVAGWYTGRARPGRPGPVVVVGHVDSRTGPGVFASLDDVGVGQQVELGLAGGGVATYRVTAVRQVPKDDFPTQDVYGAVPGEELRLITCGGRFDRSRGSYRDNVVVSAVRV